MYGRVTVFGGHPVVNDRPANSRSYDRVAVHVGAGRFVGAVSGSENRLAAGRLFTTGCRVRRYMGV
jgi:hypothetical protein